jgi:hypothetical protein
MFMVGVARQDDIVQQNFQTGGGFSGYQEVENLHAKAEKAADTAVNYSPLRWSKDIYTVVNRPDAHWRVHSRVSGT